MDIQPNHSAMCDVYLARPGKCTCGLDSLRARVAELEAKDRESLITLAQVQDRAKDKCDDLQEAILALLGTPDFRTEYECEHGTPLGKKCCIRGCHLNPVRFTLKHLPK